MTRFKLTRFLFLLICLTHAFHVKLAGKTTLKNDTVSLQTIKVSENVLDEFREDYHFKYNIATAKPGLFERFLLWISSLKGTQFLAGIAPLVLFFLLIIAFIILIVYIFRSKFVGVFIQSRNESGVNFGRSEISDNINFEQLLQEAINLKKFNLAVRYLYLILLRLLNQKKIISYQSGKTNFEYIGEINDKDIAPKFKTVTRDYEYAWYGQFPLDETSYREISSEFRRLMDQLNG